MGIDRFKVYRQEQPEGESMARFLALLINAPPLLPYSESKRAQTNSVVHWTFAIMRILDRYIVREVSRHAFLGLVVCTFVFLVPRLVRPAAVSSSKSVRADLASSQVSFQVRPRVFDGRFPKKVLYVNDVSASGTQWHGVFVAETGGESGAQVTRADSAIVIAEPRQGKLELHLQGGTTHEFSRLDANHYSVTSFGQSDWPIEVSGLRSQQPRQRSIPEQSMKELLAERHAGSREASVELHTRLAFPV